jgi:hypothetical protein
MTKLLKATPALIAARGVLATSGSVLAAPQPSGTPPIDRRARTSRFVLAMAAAVAPLLFVSTAHAALGVCDASPADNVEVEATAGTPGPTSYNTLGAAFAAINSGTHQGSIAIEVCGNTTEAASAVLNASGAGAAAYTDISVKPVGGAARTIAGNLAAPLVDLNGADGVTIDGLNSGGNTLTLSNASTAATVDTSTIRFIGGATGNTVTRASVQGSSLVPLATAGGTIEFSTDTVAATGNDNNTVSFCDIGPVGANLPIKAVFGLGTTTTLANYNSGVVIDHNNIFDFFGTGAVSVSGVHVLGGNDAWTISNNRIYQTAPRTFTATARYAGITLNSTTTGGAFTVTGNTIGFGAANGTGTTTISGGANEFRGIDATTTNITTPTVYQNNVVSGINQTTSDSGTTTSGPFIGFVLGTSDGRYNAIGNQVGSLDGSSTIVINDSTTTSSLIYGVFDFSFQSNTISNNSIGAITIQGTGTTVGFRGIYWNTGAALTETVTNNTIGSAAGPIVDSQVGNNSVYGMNGVSAAANLSGNTVSYLSANSTSNTTPIITVAGYIIGSTSTTVASTIARNAAHHLSNSAGASANSGAIYGISATLPTTLANVVERNLLHTFTVSATNTAYQLAGIVASAGTTTYRNNIVGLGLDASGNPITTGYLILGLFDPTNAAATTSQFYFNSVLISGAGVTAPGSNSYALYSNVVTNVRNFQDNILWNARGNAVAGGVAHVAIRLGTTTTGLTSNYNDLLANGTDGAIGVFNATVYPTLATWQTATTQDALSLNVDPTFVSATNLHLQPGSPVIAMGTSIAGITDDFDGNPRPATNPDIGADQFIPGQLAIAPASFDFGNQAVGSTSPATTITLSNSGGAPFNVTALTAAAAPFAQSGGTCAAVPFALAPGANCTLNYTFAPASAGVANQSFTVTASAPGATGFSLTGTGIAAPTIAKSFTPTSVAVNVNSTATITLTNPNASVATLSAALVDTLPAGLVASAASTTCTGTASFTAGSLTLASGATIPASGSCTLTGTVQSATAGSYVNNIPVGALQTSAGNNAAAATATLTVTGAVGTFPPDENFDEVTAPTLPTGWTTAATGTGVPWVTDATVSDTAPNSAHAPDFPAVSDMTLDSPTFTPAGTTTLTFRHQFNLENTYDGAVVEISINGGAFQDVIAAGGSFVSGGYIGPISSSFSSPIAGRQAWTGASAGFITTVIKLPTAATGQPSVLRFRTADDSSVAPTAPNGWWIDTLHLSFATLPSVAKSFAPASVQMSADSTLTITLTNPTVGAATLTASLVDTLPAGLVATAGTAATTCTGGTGATNTTTSITLAPAAVIPANGSCTITATVHSATAGSYVNSIGVGALQTSIGNNDTAASATLTVTSPPVAVVTPASLSFTVQAGLSGTNPLNIANTGGSNLSYSVSEGTTSINKPTSYKTASKVARDLFEHFGPASFGQSPNTSKPARGMSVVLGSTDISQMADNTPGDQGVSCGTGTTSTADNSWWRRFYFSEYPTVGASTNVSSVTISSGTAPGVTGLAITINLYTIPHGTAIDTIPTASLTPIGSGTGTIDSGLFSVTIPVTGAVANTAGTDLVVEYHTDGNASGGRFFPGANATAETHPTFLSSNTCGITVPTPAANIGTGFPNFHLTMVVTLGGTPPATCANPADIPWLSEAPAGGTVAPGANTNVTVTANATGLTPGAYTANVCVGTNDTSHALFTVPVTLTVTPAPFVPCSGGTDEIFCDGFEGAGGGTAGTYTDRTTFLTHVAAGSYENPFADAVPGASPPLNYTSGTWAYTVDASSPGPAGGLYNDTGIISTNLAADSIVVTFTGAPVTAVGGNFWATDINVQPTGTDVTITLSDATTLTFTSTGPTDFRGFTTVAPITSITIEAPDVPNPEWSTMDNLIIGTGN